LPVNSHESAWWFFQDTQCRLIDFKNPQLALAAIVEDDATVGERNRGR
jgi:hypothetical protein